MQALDHDEVSAFVDAPPERVYALVADVTRMPELSPELVRCEWLDGATGPVVGARFEATNQLPGGRPWKNRPVVTAANPGREFAFSRTERLAGTIVWRYRFEPEARKGLHTVTRVTESYEVICPVSRLGWFVIERLFGGRDRRGALRAGMTETLERLGQMASATVATDGRD